MSIKDLVVKNNFDWLLVEADLKLSAILIPHGYTVRQYAFLVTLNWSKKLGRIDNTRRFEH